MNQQSLFILDGYSVIYRSYFAFIRNPLRNSRGQNTSAVFGFLRTLQQLFSRYNPGYFAVALDSIGPTFRHEQYPPYKQTRDKTPDDLIRQIPVIESLLDALGVPQIRVEGYEADDVMASYAEMAREADMTCYVVSGDKDLLQLVGGSVTVLKPDKGGLVEMNGDTVLESWGVKPDQILDYLSLVGDSSDNVPGVKGVGAKTAASLLTQFSTLDGIYANLEQVGSVSQRKKLTEGKDSAVLSRDLIRLVRDIQLPLSIEELKVNGLDFASAAPILAQEDIKQPDVDMVSNDRMAGKTGNVPTAEKVKEITRKEEDVFRPEDSRQGEYELVQNVEAAKAWLDGARKAGRFAFDTETDSLDEMTARLVGFSLSYEEGRGCYFPLLGPDGEVLPASELMPLLKQLLEDANVFCILQNAKFDYKVLVRHGITIANIGFDTMLAAWLVDASANTFGMDALARQYLGYQTIPYSEVVGKGQTFEQVSLELAARYAGEDADITLRLYRVLQQKLERKNLDQLFRELEMPLVPLLARMELAGIKIDAQRLQKSSELLDKGMASIQTELFELVGREFNIQSTAQLQTILFEERGLKPIKKTKTGYSTDVSVLQELAYEDPVPSLVLEFRRLAKLKSTYVDALPKLINPETNRVHTHYIQTGTATGRLSSKDPNLQNIPIRDEDGRNIRRAFIPENGNVFISADYSQIELVVLAHLSDDPGLRQAFEQGKDVHSTTGALIFGLDPQQVSSEQRRIAKTINFGVMYGMSAFRLSRELRIPRKDAEHFIETYFRTYPGIQRFIQETVSQAEATGHTSTLRGRQRELPAIYSKNKNEKSGAERIAVNTPIQGTAADIMKQAMLNVDNRLQAEMAKDEGLQGTKIILQVHDEIIVECPKGAQTRVMDILKQEMVEASNLRIPLTVNVECGESWGDMH